MKPNTGPVWPAFQGPSVSCVSLAASRRGQDKLGHHRSAAVPRNQRSWEHVAICGNRRESVARCMVFVGTTNTNKLAIAACMRICGASGTNKKSRPHLDTGERMALRLAPYLYTCVAELDNMLTYKLIMRRALNRGPLKISMSLALRLALTTVFSKPQPRAPEPSLELSRNKPIRNIVQYHD